jgi:hypothetical protein
MESYQIEELFLQYMKTLPIPIQKEISCGSDFLDNLSYDAEEDLKNEIWNRIKYNTDYITIILALRDYHKTILPDSDDEEQDGEEGIYEEVEGEE